jgi:fumarylacetoacetase
MTSATPAPDARPELIPPDPATLRLPNATHDPSLRSWVASANEADADFPVQNLPFGVFRVRRDLGSARVGVAIGRMIVDLPAARALGLFDGLASEAAAVCDQPSLNALMALGTRHWSALRASLSALLREGGRGRDHAERILVGMDDVEMLVPAEVGDYTDFYASVQHATNVGSMFRPDNPLLPNYKWVPIGYHGRSSSIVASGTPVVRPTGQLKGPNDDAPVVAPSRSLDYEMEVGIFAGPPNAMGSSIPLAEAELHLFGFCLLNDWSARDVQSWEYQPLGPFLAKNFATTVSPWVVTLEALAPFRAPAYARPEGDPRPLPYLAGDANEASGNFDITLEVSLATARMRAAGEPAARLTTGRFTDMYWTPAQLVAHHTMNGCPLRPGDLLGSGTVSGADKDSRGCLLELTWRGAEPLTLPNGETRRFLEDGDEVVMRGWCSAPGATRIGFGECRGVVVG